MKQKTRFKNLEILVSA